MKANTYEKYPFRTIAISNALSLGIYAAGMVIMAHASWVAATLFLLYTASIEFRIIRFHCINCYYWGKRCGFGKGRISAWFFKKGDPSKFCAKEMTWTDMIPDLLISFIPLVAGIILLIIDFRILILAALAILIFLTTFGNGYVRGTLTCNYCKQRELGCPASNLFNNDKE